MLFSLLFKLYFWKFDEIFESKVPKVPRKDGIAAFTTVGTLWIWFGMHMAPFTRLIRRGMRPSQFVRPFLSTYLKLYGKHHVHCIREEATTTKVHSHENNKGVHGLKVTCVFKSPYIWSFARPGGTELIAMSLRHCE